MSLTKVNASADQLCSLPSNFEDEPITKRVAYYTTNDQIVIRFLQKGLYFNFEFCQSNDTIDFQIEHFDKFDKDECEPLYPRWVSVEEIEKFQVELKTTLTQKIYEAQESAEEVDSFLEKSSTFIEGIITAPLVLTESSLLYFTYKYPEKFPNRFLRGGLRTTAWGVLIYLGFSFYVQSQMEEETEPGPDKRILHLESFLLEYKKEEKKLDPQMLSTEVNKLIYLIKESLSQALKKADERSALSCGAA